MALTDRQKDTIQQALKGKIQGGCPMCGDRSWQLQDSLVHTPAVSIGGSVSLGGGNLIPLAQVICTNCGFVAFHAAGGLGIDLS